MRYFSRKYIKYEDLNPHGNLFGGRLLSWIDEEAAIYSQCQLGKATLVTKFMSEINFVSSAKLGEVIEIGFETLKFGTTSITVKCEVRTKFEKQTIITIDKVVFVNIDENSRPLPHGVTEPVNED